MFFCTDGSLIEGCARFAIHRTEEIGIGYRITTPAGVLTSELTALFVTLQHIRKALQLPKKSLIFTDF
jgi:hypothetical protein